MVLFYQGVAPKGSGGRILGDVGLVCHSNNRWRRVPVFARVSFFESWQIIELAFGWMRTVDISGMLFGALRRFRYRWSFLFMVFRVHADTNCFCHGLRSVAICGGCLSNRIEAL